MVKKNLRSVLSVILGFCGGVLFSFTLAWGGRAQEHFKAEEVVSAQKFELVNEQGVAMGTFEFDESGNPEISLRDAAGNVTWSTKPRVKTVTR
jgi:hypothetical protein